MNFFGKFWRTFAWRPGGALIALYWHLTRRRVRALNTLRSIARTAPYAYDAWQEEVEGNSATVARCPKILADWPIFPKISVLNVGEATTELTADLECQCYPHWKLHNVPAGGLVELDHAALADHVLFVGSGIRLPPTALFHFANAIRLHPGADAFYGDTDRIDAGGKRYDPWLKPDWNREMFLAQDYLSASSVLKCETLSFALREHAADARTSWSAAVTAVAVNTAASVVHVPKITAHLSSLSEFETPNPARLAVLAAALAGDGAEVGDTRVGTTKILWPLPAETDLPLVSVIIPTRDRVDLVETCVESLRTTTAYPVYEILVIDNGSVEPATLAYLARIERNGAARVLRDPSPYNFAQLNNRAVAQASGGLLCFLNNDTEVIEPGWLHALVRQAIRPEVGAVGAKLLYPDGRIQHAGIVMGMGQAAGHAHRFTSNEDPGYFLQPHIARYVAAVTGACMVVDARKFRKIGGFDEVNFAVAYNDVDLCLKLQQAGWHNVYTPEAVLIHHESVSRGDDLSEEHSPRYFQELRALQKRWSTIDAIDPYHHPDLDRTDESLSLKLW